MDELISKRAAIEAARDWYEGLICGSFKGLEKRLRALPPAQPDLSGYSDRLWKAAYERGKAEAEQRWIPVEERLPEYGESVLCYFEDDDYGVNHIIDDEDGEWFIDGVIAWMPLPESYRGE